MGRTCFGKVSRVGERGKGAGVVPEPGGRGL